MPELLIILAIVLLLFGGKKLPELSKSIGDSVRELRKGISAVPMMKRRKQKKNPDKNQSYSKNKADIRLPFIEHIRELRRRLFYIALSVLGVAFAAYAVQQRIVHIC